MSIVTAIVVQCIIYIYAFPVLSLSHIYIYECMYIYVYRIGSGFGVVSHSVTAHFALDVAETKSSAIVTKGSGYATSELSLL